MTFTESLQRVTDPNGLLLFLEVTSPSFTDPMRIVADTENHTLLGDNYIGAPFWFKLPDDVAGQVPRAVLEIAVGGTGITDELERLGPGEVPMARLRICRRNAPGVIDRDFPLPLSHVSVSNGIATANCGWDSVLRQQSVRVRFTPFLTPGAFA